MSLPHAATWHGEQHVYEICCGDVVQIETLLDETTAELAKMHLSPILATTEIAFKLRRPVPLNTTLRIECKVRATDHQPTSLHTCACLQVCLARSCSA